MKNGVPFATAFGLEAGDDFELTAPWRMSMSVIFGEFDGGEFDWSVGQWKKQR